MADGRCRVILEESLGPNSSSETSGTECCMVALSGLCNCLSAAAGVGGLQAMHRIIVLWYEEDTLVIIQYLKSCNTQLTANLFARKSYGLTTAKMSADYATYCSYLPTRGATCRQ